MNKHDGTNEMDPFSVSDPHRVPALPLRPFWLAEDPMSGEVEVSGATKDLMDTWNAWADCVEKVFQQMGSQAGELEVSDDDYINFIRMFASHPARPTYCSLEDSTEYEDRFIRAMTHGYLIHLHFLWNAYADKLEQTYVSMAAELGRCNMLAFPFEPASTRGHLHGILRSMLGPRGLFQGLVDTSTQEVGAVEEMSLQGLSTSHIEQLACEIEHMSLCPGPGMEGGEGLLVVMKKMKIKVDIPRMN